MKHDKIMRPVINIVEQINRRAVCRPGTAGADTSSSAEKNHEDSNDPLKWLVGSRTWQHWTVLPTYREVSHGRPIPGGIQGQAECGSGQPGLVVGDPAHSRGLEGDDHCGPFQPRPSYDSMNYCKVAGSDSQPTFIHLQNVNSVADLQGELHILDSIVIVDC